MHHTRSIQILTALISNTIHRGCGDGRCAKEHQISIGSCACHSKHRFPSQIAHQIQVAGGTGWLSGQATTNRKYVHVEGQLQAIVAQNSQSGFQRSRGNGLIHVYRHRSRFTRFYSKWKRLGTGKITRVVTRFLDACHR